MADSEILAGRLAAAVRSGGRGALAERLLQHQRALHAIPELAYEEHRTARYLARALEAAGLVPRTGVGGTGVVASLEGGPGPTVLVRADMDGLPIHEAPDHDPRSGIPGRMHACGHDGHMAIVLTLAERLTAVREELPGRILFLFQPAEEAGQGGPSGAQRLCEEGLLDAEGVDYVLGLHLWSYYPLGTVVVPDRFVMASSDEFRIRVIGKGGHAAVPHAARDAVLAASQIVVALQAVCARDVDPLAPAVVSVGSIHAGTAPNVLPEAAELSGTFRAPDAETRERLRRRIVETAEAIARARNVRVEIGFAGGYPPTVNDPRCAARVREALRPVFGEKVATGPPTMASEDFAFYLERRPGVFCLLGMRDEESGAVHPHHAPAFRIAPDALPLGLEVLLRGAAALLSG
ncbi:MAG: amidohydrolase [Acidobacteria bacterium]|nr:MAG: amidohydrolase [Acidobacteriota bacterium]